MEVYKMPPYTTPALHAAGEDILQSLVGGRQNIDSFPSIDAPLATRIWQHIQRVQIVQHEHASPAAAAADMESSAAAALATAAAQASTPIQVLTHLPHAGDSCWQHTGPGRAMHQFLFLPPHKSNRVRSNSKELLSRDFEGFKSGSYILGQDSTALVVRRRKESEESPSGWYIWLFVACLVKQPEQQQQQQQQQDGPGRTAQQQEQQPEREPSPYPGFFPNNTDRPDLQMYCTADEEDKADSYLVERLEPLPGLDETDTAEVATAVAAGPASQLMTAASAPLAAAGASSSPLPAAAPALAAGHAAPAGQVSSNAPATAFNRSHVIVPDTHKYNRQLYADISVGWLVAVQHTAVQPLAQSTPEAANQPAAGETSRKRQATGPAEADQPAPEGFSTAAALAAAGEAQLLEQINLLRLQSQPATQSAESNTNPWTPDRQLQLFSPDGPVQEHGGLVLKLPENPADIIQLQTAIHAAHVRGKGRNTKGENVLHLVAQTKHVNMETRLKQLQVIAGHPGLLNLLLNQQSTAGKTPLMLAAWYDPRPQFTGPPNQGRPIYHCLRWRPDVFNQLLEVSPLKVLSARDNKGWSVLHRLLHSAALAEAAEDTETQKLLHQAYASTLNRIFTAACMDLVAPKAAAAWQKQGTQQPGAALPMATDDIPMVDLEHNQYALALQFVEAVRSLPDPPAKNSSSRYQGGSQRAAGDAEYEQRYMSTLRTTVVPGVVPRVP